jgi:uncharacterized protein (TIGR02757 family)
MGKTERVNKDDFVFELLERKYHEYNNSTFIENDPISVPHRFTKKQNIEIIGFWIAMLAWGNRKSIITSGNRLAELLEGAPHDFILNHQEKDLKRFLDFKHRTFNATDALYFIEFFKQHYTKHESLEDAFLITDARSPMSEVNTENALMNFYNNFFSLENSPHRTRKHIATPERNSTCKRLNMFKRTIKVV